MVVRHHLSGVTGGLFTAFPLTALLPVPILPVVQMLEREMTRYTPLTSLPDLVVPLGALVLLLLLAPAAMAQTPDAQEGYLLSGKLHAEPDSFSDEVQAIGRDERVRVVPVADEEGWHVVYRAGESQPLGYTFRPFISRLGSSDLAALQADGEQPLTPATTEDDKLPGVVFSESLTDDGVLVQVEEWANVRVGPGVSTEAFGVIRPHVPFRVLEVNRGWGKIKLEGEHEYGYVSGSLLHRVDEPEDEPAQESVAEDAEARTAFTISGASAGGSATLGDDEEAGEAPEEAGVEETTGVVYVTRTGHKYHRADCKHLRSVKFAMPLAEAMQDFAPCRTCTPPTRPLDEPEP